MKTFLPALALTILSANTVFAAGFEVLVPHRAVYDVSLVEAQGRSGIEAMSGRIVYELTGNACEGIAVRFRFVTKIQTGRDEFVTDQQSASHESADGKEFSFTTKSFVNDQQDQDISGSAVQKESGIRVNLGGKEPREIDLPSGLFTTSHLIAIMQSAEKGVPFLSHKVFDGSGDGDNVLDSATVIGLEKRVEEKLEGESGKELGGLLDEGAWPVTMSYFDTKVDNTAESLPIYEASFLLYKNGVTRDLTMRYPDYELKAVLSELEYFDADECE